MQVPTFRADPLTPACDTWCEFPVSDRPNAVRQFMDAAVKDPSLIKVLPPPPYTTSYCEQQASYLAQRISALCFLYEAS